MVSSVFKYSIEYTARFIIQLKMTRLLEMSSHESTGPKIKLLALAQWSSVTYEPPLPMSDEKSSLMAVRTFGTVKSK